MNPRKRGTEEGDQSEGNLKRGIQQTHEALLEQEIDICKMLDLPASPRNTTANNKTFWTSWIDDHDDDVRSMKTVEIPYSSDWDTSLR